MRTHRFSSRGVLWGSLLVLVVVLGGVFAACDDGADDATPPATATQAATPVIPSSTADLTPASTPERVRPRFLMTVRLTMQDIVDAVEETGRACGQAPAAGECPIVSVGERVEYGCRLPEDGFHNRRPRSGACWLAAAIGLDPVLLDIDFLGDRLGQVTYLNGRIETPDSDAGAAAAIDLLRPILSLLEKEFGGVFADDAVRWLGASIDTARTIPIDLGAGFGYGLGDVGMGLSGGGGRWDFELFAPGVDGLPPDNSLQARQPALPGVTVASLLDELVALGLRCADGKRTEPDFQEWNCQDTVQSAVRGVEYHLFVSIGSQDGQLACGLRANFFGGVFPWNSDGPDATGVSRLEAQALASLPPLAAVAAPAAAEEAIDYASRVIAGDYSAGPAETSVYRRRLADDGPVLGITGESYSWGLDVYPEGVTACLFP